MHNPGRAREDAEGVGDLRKSPPRHLPADVVPCWRGIVDRLPKITLTASDEYAIEQAARAMAGIRALDGRQEIINRMLAVENLTPEEAVAIATAMSDMASLFKRYDDVLRQWLVHLGMTPLARTKFATSGKNKDSGNKFGRLKGAAG